MGKTAAKTGIVYCRTSTRGQKEAATIEAQILRCKSLIQTHGVTLLPYGKKKDGWVKDDGVSGSLLEGREFARLIDDLEHGRVRFDYLIVYSMSRLARHDKTSKEMEKLVKSAVDKARIMAVLNGAKVKIIDQEGVNDPASVLTEIKETLSGEEYSAIKKRTMDGKARVLANGAWATGGRVPFGYKRVFVNGKDKKNGTTLAPDEVDGPRFLQVMAWYIEGGASYAATHAMKQGWPSPRGSKTWYPSTIQQLLNNIGAYLGETTLTIDGQPYDVKYPRLVDPKTYGAILRRKKERTLKKRTTLLSTGFVDCACGGHLHGTASATTGRYYLGCRSRCGTIRSDLFCSKLWELVVARLVQIKEHEQIASNGKDPYRPQLEAAEGKLKKVEEQIDRLLDLYTDGTIDKAALQRKSASLKESKANLASEVARLRSQREEHAQRRQGVHSVHDRVQDTLKKIKAGVPFEAKRKVLSDLLQGDRVILTWGTAKKPNQKTRGRASQSGKITLPSFGQLAPITVDMSKDITTQIHGVSRAVLDVYYNVDDAVDDVSM